MEVRAIFVGARYLCAPAHRRMRASLMPITTPIRAEDPNKTVKPTVNAYIWLVVGLFIATFLGGVLYYILAQMNSTGITIPDNVNVLKYLFNFNNIIGLLFAMVIVVAAVALIIIYLMRTMRQTGLEE
jgi:uncharacterized membrane protein